MAYNSRDHKEVGIKRRGYNLDYRIYNYCPACNLNFRKPLEWCNVCGFKLRTSAK